MTARSTGSGMAARLGYDLMPRMLLYLGLTGKIVPPKDVEIRFHRMVRATLPGRSVAPTTATLFGLNITSSGFCSMRSTLWAVLRTIFSVSDIDSP
jgi:hypothetical protein